MPALKRKPVEANDGSYGGEVLAECDRLFDGSDAHALPPGPSWVPVESNDELSPFEGELYRDVLAERAIATLADNVEDPA